MPRPVLTLYLLLILLTLLAAPFNPFNFGPTSAHAVDLTSGLVGHWTFDKDVATYGR